ncbi:Protein S40-4 [Cardamine amara subsp. amara]|uniref:Protein S40-4 n=1 Tax=Cardamine amara subsp. amara TaxID=228776 RepID=A0ABD1A888_CARAN
MEKNNMRHEVWRSLRDGEFEEDDVWGVLDGYQSSFLISNHTNKPSFSTQTSLPSEPRMIPERQSIEGMAPMRQYSAPVNVPDWSMVHSKKTKKVVDDDDDDDDDDEKVSPEEYFLRRSRSSSSSVMEGVGRKLKGRDLSKVRNAVLKQTGFLE